MDCELSPVLLARRCHISASSGAASRERKVQRTMLRCQTADGLRLMMEIRCVPECVNITIKEMGFLRRPTPSNTLFKGIVSVDHQCGGVLQGFGRYNTKHRPPRSCGALIEWLQ